MFAIPQVGVAHSVNKHNCDLAALADWVEATIVFGSKTKISGSDVVDLLTEEDIYDEQSFAWEMVDLVWIELRRRAECMGKGCLYAISGKSVTRLRRWKEAPAHAFCLALALAKWYPKWARTFGNNYTAQGAIFEDLSVSALTMLMPEWIVTKTGWSSNAPNKIHTVVPLVSKALCETTGNITPWVNSGANEAGLDVICYRPLSDNRPGLPALMIQCASGLDYFDKALTPDLKTWGKLVSFVSVPKRALATPFAFEENEFRQICNRVDGPLFDRYRLLHAGRTGKKWLNTKLAKSMVDWVRPRITTLPLSN